MLIGRLLLIILMRSTFIIYAALTTTTAVNHRPTTPPEHSPLPAVPYPVSLAANQNECQQPCSIDYCLKSLPLSRNCTKLVRDQCDCCTVCLRAERQACGGHLNVHGLCEQDLLCYKSNRTLVHSTGICIRACLKFQCLSVVVSGTTVCQCANRRVPCDAELQQVYISGLAQSHCEEPTRELSLLKANDPNELLNCSAVVCPTEPAAANATQCSSDSHFVEDHTPLLRLGPGTSANLTSICCEARGQCVCSPCSKTICGENSIMQIYRTGNPNLPGHCCDQFNCIKNSKQCHHDKKIYNENETWSIDHCTTCTCRAGLVDCVMVQCPTYSHCGYMYKPENECCPKCGGCLNDRLHLQHMNSTWIESNGCMRCWCENGRSRCIAEGCIAPPCENPRQIANVCCPVCDQPELGSEIDASRPLKDRCPPLDRCSLVCEYGLVKDDQGCLQCTCATMSCPTPLCTLKFDRSKKPYCACLSSHGLGCQSFHCDKHCPYNYSLDKETGCPKCECDPCPTLSCNKNCTYGLKRNDIGCSICVCQSAPKTWITTNNLTVNADLTIRTWPRQCHSGSFSYSNGEIWFDGCRQCLCHRGEPLCALISCSTPKCSQPVFLPNRCCPSCPDSQMLPEPIPSSQVCYASQYVTGEELEFDKCTKCLCLHNVAFCSVSLCPPLRCSSPIYDSSLCCPVCPPRSEPTPSTDLANMDHVCLLDNGLAKHAGELWKQNDCQSCLCSREGNGQIECFSQMCDQQLPCSHPVLKKGQCCPFCLPPTAAVAVCIFNYVQYRSGEHWNVSECHRCECSLGTIVCHQHQCPSLTCVNTVTLSGHCCPICRDQIAFITDPGKLRISQSRFGLTIIIIFSTFILLLILVIIILIFILLRGGHRALSSSNQLSSVHHRRSPNMSPHPTLISSKPSTIFSYVKYDLMSMSNDETPTGKPVLSSSSQIPLTSLEQTSTHSMVGTTITTTGTNSSNNELEPGTWNEDDAMLHCSASLSDENDDDDDEEQEIISTDNDESHHHHHHHHGSIQMQAGPPTIIYV